MQSPTTVQQVMPAIAKKPSTVLLLQRPEEIPEAVWRCRAVGQTGSTPRRWQLLKRCAPAVEKTANGAISVHVRFIMRSEGQNLALSALGLFGVSLHSNSRLCVNFVMRRYD